MQGVRIATMLAVAIAIATVVLACAGTAAPPAGLATAAASPTGTPAATTGASGSPAASQRTESRMPFTITSTDFPDGGPIPRKFSCDGENVSPALNWEGVPDGAATLALIVDDPDARGFVHWVVFNMTASQTGGLAEAVSASPDAPTQGKNGRGTIGWTGPCPPSGTHRYAFTLLALDDTLALPGTPTADELREAAGGHILAEAVLTGTYTRGG